MSTNNLLLRASFDKVHAPDSCAGCWFCVCEQKVRRVAAEQGR